MSTDFHLFARAVNTAFMELSKDELYTVVPPLDIFNSYLAAFPAGTNPIFRERTEHDCSCCKNFIRNLGLVVSLKDNKVRTVWGNMPPLPEPYATVAAQLDALIKQQPLDGIFRTKESKYGSEHTYEGTHRWNHFWGEVPKRFQCSAPDAERGRHATNVAMLQRAMDELTIQATDAVLDLIKDGALYRGEEHKRATEEFLALKKSWEATKTDSKMIFAHLNASNPVGRFRNTVIGTLVTDISEGKPLEDAVRMFESKVAPTNYKRTKALITPKMIDAALATLETLGLSEAIERRYATIGDVSVNDVLFVNNAVKRHMKGGLRDTLMEAATVRAVADTSKTTPIGIEMFVKDVVPKAKTITLAVTNAHLPNFMSLTAPKHESTGRLFQWDNDFAWSYDGEIADSDMRQAVVARGGSVTGVFRFTHSWNYRERNASLMDLHVFMPGHPFGPTNPINDMYGNAERVGWNARRHMRSGGVQDVDYTQPAPAGYVPVENITFPSLDRMREGTYICKIHNWQRRAPTEGGFKAEIEFGGQIFQYEYRQPLRNKEWITVAEVTLKAGQFTIKHHLPCGAAPQTKWGIKTQTFVPVTTLLNSPNHWENAGGRGAKHWFFILDGCNNPEETRGLYNEFLRNELTPHRKVFEVLGAKTKCPHSTDQLSGLGFTLGRGQSVVAMVSDGTNQRSYSINF